MRLNQHFNAVVLGAGGVGKSALTVRFGRNQFVEQYNPTIEENYTCNIDLDNTRSVLEILDTPGMEQFTALNENYIKSAHGFVLVFSLAQDSTLRDIDNLRQIIYQIKGTQNVPIVVVGTKLDLTHEREVSRNTIQDLAKTWRLPFYETSAKRNWHVQEVFHDLLRQMRKRYPQNDQSPRKKKKEECVLM